MKYFSKDNWVSWQYDNGELHGRSPSDTAKFQTVYKPTDEPIGSLWEEAVKGAQSTLECNPGLRPSLFFSGGVDSEVMLKAFLHINSKPNVYVVRFEDDINLYDVSYAVSIANSMNVDIKIIDMNIKKFFENEAEKISELAQCDRPRGLPQMKFADYVDGLPILCMADVTWQRSNDDYTRKGIWKAWEIESDCAYDRYNIAVGRDAIYQWGRWTQGILIAHTRWKWFHKLINDYYPGKLGNSSTKFEGFSEEFPSMIPRRKKVGFEKCENIIKEFETFLHSKYNGLPFRRQSELSLDEMWIALTKKDYAANNV